MMSSKKWAQFWLKLSDLQEVMRENELNIRTAIYEILLKDETNASFNIKRIGKKISSSNRSIESLSFVE